ncbi:MAG: 16S rRNA (cytosine(967)-C(5))-methyltransferase RsmB [bacterium]
MTTKRATPSSAREAAFAVLHRAEAADAFVSILLYHTLARSALSSADRALATEITLGVLRHRARLDHALAPLVSRPLADLPAAIRTILRMGAYQLLMLDRIPPSAAVSEATSLARRHGHTGTAGLVNAVLRRLGAEGAPALPDPLVDPIEHAATAHSHPRWLMARWAARFGMEEAAALAAAYTRPAPSTVRANTLLVTPAELVEALRAAGVSAEIATIPESVRVRGSLVDRLPLLGRGWFAIQDEGAMLVSHALAPRPTAVVVDACAAPGGKTTHLAALLGNVGRVLACDIHQGKVDALVRRCVTMGATCVEARHLDARALGKDLGEIADAVLVDAPCSGLGTIRRRPEIKWRISEAVLARHAEAQQAILAGAAGAVRPGGVLVYSVCSLEPEEGPQVISAFLTTHPSFERAPLPETFPRQVAGSPVEGAAGGEVFLLPHRHETDGFYIARLHRR